MILENPDCGKKNKKKEQNIKDTMDSQEKNGYHEILGKIIENKIRSGTRIGPYQFGFLFVRLLLPGITTHGRSKLQSTLFLWPILFNLLTYIFVIFLL